MKDFRLSPAGWRALTRFQRQLLFYHRLMEQYYTQSDMDRRKREADQERNRQKFLGSLPPQQVRRR